MIIKVKIEHIQKEDERLKKEFGITGYADMFLRGVNVEGKIADVPTPQYKHCIAWKEDRLTKAGNVAAARRPMRPKAYASPPPPPAESWLVKGPKLWVELHSRAQAFAGDVEAERAWMHHFSSRIGCGECRGHWLDLVQKLTPPDFTSAAAYYAWTVAAHNAVNLRLGKPEWSPADAADAPLVFNLGSTGLGDAICGLYAACGLADATGRKVIYYAHSSNWINRASHPNVEIRARIAGDMGANPCKDMKDYGEQINSAETRVQFYADRLAAQLGVGQFEGKRPHTINTAHTNITSGKGTVVVAPFCCFTSRDWGKYTQLTLELEAAGYLVVGIGSVTQANGLERVFKPTRATYHWGKSPQEIANLLLGAKLVIGNDSGIPHLGGLLGVPTISIHAGSLSHGFLFDFAPSVRSVTATKTLPRSDHNPDALKSISVEMVMRKAGKILGEQEESVSITEAKHRTLLGDMKFDALMRTLGALDVAGDVAELGVYKGGSAAGMALTAPKRTVYAFDTFEGMPDLAKPVDVHKAGEFADVESTIDFLGRLPNMAIRRGIFPATATGMEEKRFALVHLDGDLYESTLAGLKWFWPRLSPGGKIVLDDWEWPRCPGVEKAVEEYFAGVPHLRVLTATYQLTIEKPTVTASV